jgi:chromosome segregation protein
MEGATMSTTQETMVERQPRLAAAGQRIDSLHEKARRVGDDARTTAARRIDDLRAREAQARADLRDVRDAVTEERVADAEAVDAELSKLEHEIEIADAELDAEMAADAEAYVEAAERAAAAWDAYLDELDERADAASDAAGERLHGSVTRARSTRDEAKRRIDAARRASSESWASARKEVRQGFDDLDWAADQAASDIARYFE